MNGWKTISIAALPSSGMTVRYSGMEYPVVAFLHQREVVPGVPDDDAALCERIVLGFLNLDTAEVEPVDTEDEDFRDVLGTDGSPLRDNARRFAQLAAGPISPHPLG